MEEIEESQLNLNRVIDILNGVIEDLEKVCPLILKYINEPLSISFSKTKQPDFYTIQLAERL